jgi:DNA-binding response OmpR family regulator
MDAGNISNCKILIIDDEKDLRNLLETYLSKEGFTNIYKAENGYTGIEVCRREKPDIIVLDVMMPDIDGFEVCRRLREFTYAPILFLSAREEEVDKLLGLGIGGDDYITKPFSLKEVTFRIKAQLRRKQYMGADSTKSENKNEIYRFGHIQVDEAGAEVLKNGVTVDLTAKELQLFTYMVNNANLILSKRKIYEAIWGEEYMGDDNTIMVHIRHLREKLEDDPGNPRHLITVKGLGYKFVSKGV